MTTLVREGDEIVSMSQCLNVCLCVYLLIISTRECFFERVYISLCVSICVYVCLCVLMHVCLCVRMCVCVYGCAFLFVWRCIITCIYTCAFSHTVTRTATHTHTHTYTHRWLGPRTVVLGLSSLRCDLLIYVQLHRWGQCVMWHRWQIWRARVCVYQCVWDDVCTCICACMCALCIWPQRSSLSHWPFIPATWIRSVIWVQLSQFSSVCFFGRFDWFSRIVFTRIRLGRSAGHLQPLPLCSRHSISPTRLCCRDSFWVSGWPPGQCLVVLSSPQVCACVFVCVDMHICKGVCMCI